MGSRPVDGLGHRTRRARLALVVATVAVALAGAGAAADETVRFDGAGDAPSISLIGDSTLTGVRWYADYGSLRQYNFVLDAESCRRTIERSCISREGYRSATVVQAIRTLGDELGEVLVVMTGYNDPGWAIDESIDGVVDAARAEGVGKVVWLTLRTSADVDYSDPQQQTSTDTFREYNEQLVTAAASSNGFLQIADWATYSAGASSWFEYDGVHLTPAGVDALTGFIASTVARVLSGDDVSPAAAPWTVLVPGAEGDTVAAVQTALIAAGIDLPGGADGVYGNDTMAAVAEFQRRRGELQVTGAVDLATARALGVQRDDELESVPTTAAPAPLTTGLQRTSAGRTTVELDAGSHRAFPWAWAIVGIIGSLAAIVVARRRYVVRQRAARRWARVHPATSPVRSVADLRRSGEMPPTGRVRLPEPAELGAGVDPLLLDER